MLGRLTGVGLAVLLVVATGLSVPEAAAQRMRSGRSYSGPEARLSGAVARPTSLRTQQFNPVASRERGAVFGSPGTSRMVGGRGDTPILDGIGGALNNRNRGQSNTPILDALGGRGGNGSTQTPILDALIGDRVNQGSVADYFFGDRFRQNRYDADEAYADAYRDVGIANAVASVLGIVAQGYLSQQHYAGPQEQYAPQPSGHYVRERVVIQEARYEQYQVWIPPRFDSRTGQQIGGGFHEARTRLIPEETAYRDVWVPGN